MVDGKGDERPNKIGGKVEASSLNDSQSLTKCVFQSSVSSVSSNHFTLSEK
ncbi:hypothetical protein D515_01715 [Grimontia indica]|uniref:Uncharacterized protein n=1 Tax=Grimontia indica TaxID=1056512 RepID=R1IWG1_9GAMM|nr:hypothetical protein D515_01715 [Grimontia indica]